MTYSRLKSLTKALLIGDNQLTTSNEELLALLAYAYDKIATEADALKLFTTNKDNTLLRQGPGNTFVRKPNLPDSDEDTLDIDDELGYPAARFIASFISRDKGGIHYKEAMNLIKSYNHKVQAYMESLDQENQYDTSGN